MLFMELLVWELPLKKAFTIYLAYNCLENSSMDKLHSEMDMKKNNTYNIYFLITSWQNRPDF